LKILVLGHSPSSKEYDPKKGNPTINRLNKWLSDVEVYSYSNICMYHVDSIKKKDINESYIRDITKGYNKIIGLGNEVKRILTKMDIKHFALPHPSPLNRKLNCKVYELKIINKLKAYLQIDA